MTAPRPIMMSAARLQEALRSEYPPGQVTFSAWDALAILAALGLGEAPAEEEAPDPDDFG